MASNEKDDEKTNLFPIILNMTTKTNAIFATAYFPPITYMAKLGEYQSVIIEQYETYPKQTYRNRAVIATAMGSMSLSVPVVKRNGNHTITKDIDICNHENWRIKHCRAIEAAYNSSPYFMYYKDDIFHILNQDYSTLPELNIAILRFLAKKLHIKTEIRLSVDFVFSHDLPADTDDYRNYFSTKTTDNSISSLPVYDQVFADRVGFLPNVSILDLLFNMGPEANQYLKIVSKLSL